MGGPEESDELRLSPEDVDYYLKKRPWLKKIIDRLRKELAFSLYPTPFYGQNNAYGVAPAHAMTQVELGLAARRKDTVTKLRKAFDRAYEDFDKKYPVCTDRDTFDLVYWFWLKQIATGLSVQMTRTTYTP